MLLELGQHLLCELSLKSRWSTSVNPRKKGVALGVFAAATYLLTRSGVEGGDDLIEQRDVELGLGEIEDCLRFGRLD